MRFSALSSEGIVLSDALHIVLIYIASWRLNLCEIAVKNCEKSKTRPKSLCAPLLLDI